MLGILQVLGPGLITGASDDDPSGIGTYSQVGSQFGFGVLWTAVFTFPMMAAIQELCARIALETGVGPGVALRRKFPGWLVGYLPGPCRRRSTRTPLARRRRAPAAARAGSSSSWAAPLDQVLDETGLELPPGEYSTLAGFLLDRLGDLSEVGDEVALDGWLLRVVSQDGHRIAWVEVHGPGQPAG